MFYYAYARALSLCISLYVCIYVYNMSKERNISSEMAFRIFLRNIGKEKGEDITEMGDGNPSVFQWSL